LSGRTGACGSAMGAGYTLPDHTSEAVQRFRSGGLRADEK
jgi:hypothetical protein